MDKPAQSTADTEKMLSLPVGAISPLWLMFAGAATVGAASTVASNVSVVVSASASATSIDASV